MGPLTRASETGSSSQSSPHRPLAPSSEESRTHKFRRLEGDLRPTHAQHMGSNILNPPRPVKTRLQPIAAPLHTSTHRTEAYPCLRRDAARFATTRCPALTGHAPPLNASPNHPPSGRTASTTFPPRDGTRAGQKGWRRELTGGRGREKENKTAVVSERRDGKAVGFLVPACLVIPSHGRRRRGRPRLTETRRLRIIGLALQFSTNH